MARAFFVLFLAAAASVQLSAQPAQPPRSVTNSMGMKFVWIPPGSFIMGSPPEELGRIDNEIQHKVTLTKGFYLGIYTVTQEEWKEVMGNNPSEFKIDAQTKRLPVETISWDDCQIFIAKMRERDKKPYRLPTEAEWEYACRAGTTTPFYCGETISYDDANYDAEGVYGNGKKGLYRGKPTPVGTFPPNPWGLYDMHGNVWQHCHDTHGEYTGKDEVDPQGATKGRFNVLRGGAYYSDPVACRSAMRYWWVPASRRSHFGVRLCFNAE